MGASRALLSNQKCAKETRPAWENSGSQKPEADRRHPNTPITPTRLLNLWIVPSTYLLTLLISFTSWERRRRYSNFVVFRNLYPEFCALCLRPEGVQRYFRKSRFQCTPPPRHYSLGTLPECRARCPAGSSRRYSAEAGGAAVHSKCRSPELGETSCSYTEVQVQFPSNRGAARYPAGALDRAFCISSGTRLLFVQL
jgi:hypothetical protein